MMFDAVVGDPNNTIPLLRNVELEKRQCTEAFAVLLARMERHRSGGVHGDESRASAGLESSTGWGHSRGVVGFRDPGGLYGHAPA